MSTCIVCAKEYTPAKHHSGNYCSNTCWYKSQRIEYRFPQLTNKAWCQAQYEQHSYREVSTILGCGETIVFEWFQKHGIISKTRAERLKGRKKPDGYAQKKSAEMRQKSSQWESDKNPNWQGGSSMDNYMARRTPDANRWRREVIRNANHKCQRCGIAKGTTCGDCGVPMPFYAHHIKPFSKFPELRYAPSNGEYLCFHCHSLQHTA